MSRGRVYTDRESLLRKRISQAKYKKSKKGKIVESRYRKESRKSVQFKKRRIERTKLWRLNNPIKRSAHQKVQWALRKKTIKKEPCRVCNKKRVHAHHEDYNKPLEVLWLCPAHHAERHNMEK